MALLPGDVLAALQNAWLKVRQLSVLGDIDCNNLIIRGRLLALNGAIVPVGGCVPFAGSLIPSSFLLCDGTTYTQTAQPVLYAALSGTNFVSGSNVTVPDLRGRTVHGVGSVGTNAQPTLALGATGGEQNHTLTTGESAVLTYTSTDSGHTHTYSQDIATNTGHNVGTGTGLINGATHGTTSSNSAVITTTANGGGGGHNTMSPYMALNWIIRAA